MDLRYIIFLTISFVLEVNKSTAQTEAVKYLNNIYGGKLDGVKTVKIYYYNASNGGVKSNISSNKYYQLTELEQDKNNRALYELTIKPTETGLDTTYSYRCQYEIENELLILHHKYWNWPNTTEYQLTKYAYTFSKQIHSEESTVSDDKGKIKSYQKIIYEYDDKGRLILKRDSFSNTSSPSVYEQIISGYYYDTLGVKCYIEENKVRNYDGFTELLGRSFLTDSIGKTNREYFYKLSPLYSSSQYVEFDKQKNLVRNHKYRIKHIGDLPYADSTLVENTIKTYNGKNQIIYYEDKIENSFIKYVYNYKYQLIERYGKKHFAEYKEFFKYNSNGNLSEYTENWNGKISRTAYEDYNKLGIAETVIRYNDKGEISHITKRKFTFW